MERGEKMKERERYNRKRGEKREAEEKGFVRRERKRERENRERRDMRERERESGVTGERGEERDRESLLQKR